MAISAALWRSLKAYQIYGANTDVGKTVVSTILCNAVNKRRRSQLSAFLKPISTGSLDEADNEHIKKYAPGTLTRCLYQFNEPVSPHIAARLHDSTIPGDNQILSSIHDTLAEWQKRSIEFALVETAGGVHSPGPNGNSQADFYRPLRLPVILVADPRLGGISSSISAYESLLLRGYDVGAVLVFQDDYYKNHEFLGDYFAKKGVSLIPLLAPPPKPMSGDANVSLQDEENMSQYYHHVSLATDVAEIVDKLELQHAKRIERLEEMPQKAHQMIWYPFTQHHGIQPTDITPIDSAYGDHFQTFSKEDSHSNQLKSSFDGSASWWTQGLGHGNPSLSLAAAYAAGRYGHVMFPGNIHEPGLALAESLLSGLGNPRLGKVFYSDDGSTGMEVAVKMGLRAAGDRYKWDASQDQINILGLRGSYHGDTIGVMDCAEPSIYNKKVEWYRGRGFWFDFPQVIMSRGTWKVVLPGGIDVSPAQELQFSSLGQVFDVDSRLDSPTAQLYSKFIYEKLKEVTATGMKFGALLMEPVILGAGGMFLCDPLFQRCLVDVVRGHPELFSCDAKPIKNPPKNKWSGLPVIFDEVFTGLYRLGRKTAGSFLGVDPDVIVNAKLLTGGLVPLCTTAASNEIFDVFSTPDKTDALLHGHSYTAHPVGCQVALESLQVMADMEASGAWDSQKQDWEHQSAAKSNQTQHSMDVWSMWSRQLVTDISHCDIVDGVFSIGSVLAIHLRDDEGKGYASGAARVFQQILLAGEDNNVHARVLGNVLYLMCSITSRRSELGHVEQLVKDALS